jgi:hypothetical protein
MDRNELVNRLENIDGDIAEVFIFSKRTGVRSILVFLVSDPSNDDFIKYNDHWYIYDDIYSFISKLDDDITVTAIRPFDTDYKKRSIQYTEYNGIQYPYRTTKFNQTGKDILVGCGSLDRSLFDDIGYYIDGHAKSVDEKFYGYASDSMILTLSDDEFNAYVNAEFS